MRSLIEDVLDCATDPHRWDAALDRFAETLGVRNACLFVVDEDYAVAPVMRASRGLREGAGAEAVRAYTTHEVTGDEPIIGRLAGMQSGVLHHECAICGVNTLDDLPPSAVRDRTYATGVHARFAGVMNQNGPWFDLVAVHARDAAQERAFARDDRTSLILPIIERTIEFQRLFDTMRSRYGAALSMLDRLGLGVMLMNANGDVMLSNREAQRVFDLDDGLQVGADKQLVCKNPDDTARLASVIEAATVTALGGVRRPETVTLKRPSGAFDFVISAGALSDIQAELEPGLRCGMVVVIDPSRPDALNAHAVAELGKLTPAEAEIATALVQGLRAEDIAERRDTSLHTVRGQMKTVAAKLRCQTQADIIRLAAATQLPFTDPE